MVSLKEGFYRQLERNRKEYEGKSETSWWYDTANRLSLKNAKYYNRCILFIAVLGVIFASCFLMYFDVFELDNIITIALLVLLSLIVCIFIVANKMQFHKKYMEYRILAEAFRVQNYISKAGVDRDVSDMLPLLIEKDLGWIKDVLREFPRAKFENESIKEYWIEYQRNYHERTLKKAQRKKKLYDTTSDAIIVLTVISYFAILILELFIMNHFTIDQILFFTPLDLKFYLGVLSVVALLYNSIYGKMSLNEMTSNYERMISLYDDALKEIEANGKTDELVINLAKECLTENSLWYAFQKQNKIELII